MKIGLFTTAEPAEKRTDAETRPFNSRRPAALFGYGNNAVFRTKSNRIFPMPIPPRKSRYA